MSGPAVTRCPERYATGRALCSGTEGGPRMAYVGIDLHRKRSHVAVVDERGEQLLSRRLVNDRERFRELLGALGEDARFALEGPTGRSGWASCWSRRVASCIWRIRCARRRSRRRG